jgi:hypothetical protein
MDKEDPTFWYKDKSNIVNYAATNNLIVLFPTVFKCWDTRQEKGLGSEGNATNEGAQVKAIMAMIERILSK